MTNTKENMLPNLIKERNKCVYNICDIMYEIDSEFSEDENDNSIKNEISVTATHYGSGITSKQNTVEILYDILFFIEDLIKKQKEIEVIAGVREA